MVPVQALIRFPKRPKDGWESLPIRFSAFPSLTNFHFRQGHPKQFVCWFSFEMILNEDYNPAHLDIDMWKEFKRITKTQMTPRLIELRGTQILYPKPPKPPITLNQVLQNHNLLQQVGAYVVDDLLDQGLISLTQPVQPNHPNREEQGEVCEEAELEKHGCGACSYYKKSHACIPCGHLILCGPCSTTIEKKCPQCRAPVSSFIKIFF